MAGLIAVAPIHLVQLAPVLKAGRKSWRDTRRRSVFARSRGLSLAVTRWMQRYARAALPDARQMIEGRFSKKLNTAKLESELLDLLMRYGLLQVNAAGKTSAAAAGAKWKITPSLIDEYGVVLADKVALIMDSTETLVRDSTNRILRDALEEIPRPTGREIARRLARTWHGPPSARDGTFSFERASAIARTEVGDADTFGISAGLEVAGIDITKWLSVTRDRRSGKRKHWKMNGDAAPTAALRDNNRKDEWFLTPLGNRMPRPLWSGAPVIERVNCRCSIGPG